jgi:phospholipid transport system substrate-binding protein
MNPARHPASIAVAFRAAAIGLAITCLLPIAATTARAQAQASAPIDYTAEPVPLVRTVSETLFERIDDQRAIYEQDQDALRAMIREVFLPLLNQRYSARLVLGRHGRSLSEQQIDDFADALTERLLDNYASGLLDYNSKDRVQVLALRGDENDERLTRVRTRVRLNSGEFAPVDYVLRKFGDRWQAFDVIIEGISYVSTYRNQFGEEIARNGFDRTLARLRSGELELDKGDDD